LIVLPPPEAELVADAVSAGADDEVEDELDDPHAARATIAVTATETRTRVERMLSPLWGWWTTAVAGVVVRWYEVQVRPRGPSARSRRGAGRRPGVRPVGLQLRREIDVASGR